MAAEEIAKGLHVRFYNLCLLNLHQVHCSYAHLCSKTSSSRTKQTTSVSIVAFQSCPRNGSGETQYRQYLEVLLQEYILIKKCSLGITCLLIRITLAESCSCYI